MDLWADRIDAVDLLFPDIFGFVAFRREMDGPPTDPFTSGRASEVSLSLLLLRGLVERGLGLVEVVGLRTVELR